MGKKASGYDDLTRNPLVHLIVKNKKIARECTAKTPQMQAKTSLLSHIFGPK